MKLILAILAFLFVLGVSMFVQRSAMSQYYSVQERRLPCGKIMRREVVEENDAWRKTVTLMDPDGHVIATKTHIIEPEQCNRIRAGQFIPGLWRDCSIPI